MKCRLTEYLSDNNLQNSHQSAYIKSRSTKYALLYVHGHIIEAMSLQKVTALTLLVLDLSAAFDTIDHAILLEHLFSWFEITSTALAWLTSQLQNRSFMSLLTVVITAIQLLINFSMAYLKGLFLVLFSSSYTLLHSALF